MKGKPLEILQTESKQRYRTSIVKWKQYKPMRLLPKLDYDPKKIREFIKRKMAS